MTIYSFQVKIGQVFIFGGEKFIRLPNIESYYNIYNAFNISRSNFTLFDFEASGNTKVKVEKLELPD